MAGSARPRGATRLLGVRAGGWLLHLSGLVHERVQAPGSPGWTAPRYCLHDVRHAVATELGRQGVQPVIVSAVLGHSSSSFTIAVYQHAWQEGPAEAAAALEAALGPSPGLAIRWHAKGSDDPQPGDASQSSWSEEWAEPSIARTASDLSCSRHRVCL